MTNTDKSLYEYIIDKLKELNPMFVTGNKEHVDVILPGYMYRIDITDKDVTMNKYQYKYPISSDEKFVIIL